MLADGAVSHKIYYVTILWRFSILKGNQIALLVQKFWPLSSLYVKYILYAIFVSCKTFLGPFFFVGNCLPNIYEGLAETKTVSAHPLIPQ